MSPARAYERRQRLLADPAAGRVPEPSENSSGMLPFARARARVEHAFSVANCPYCFE
jgi:hypothetical protein